MRAELTYLDNLKSNYNYLYVGPTYIKKLQRVRELKWFAIYFGVGKHVEIVMYALGVFCN